MSFSASFAYNKLGIYCPQIIPNRSGELSYKYTKNGRNYYIYAEDFAKYNIAENIGIEKLKDSSGKRCYLDDMLRSVGKVAAQHFDFCNFNSAYSILTPFSTSDTMDEGTECATIFRNYVRDNIPKYYLKVEKLMELYFSNQCEVQKIYEKLPVSCFQADSNDSNVLVDNNYHFAGLIDFNLSGKEPILNYTVREALWNASLKSLYGEHGERLYWYDSGLDKLRIELFIHNITCIQEHYSYSKIEREAFPVLFRYMNSFWWHQVDEIKRIKDDDWKIELLLRWLEHQMTRDDIRLPG